MYSTPFDTAPPASRQRRPRRRILAAVIAALLVLAFGQVAAYATHYQASLEGSNFQIDDDANFVVDAHATVNLDWNNVTEARQQDLATGSNDNSYSGGTKEDTVCPSTGTGSIPNNKSDLKTFGVYKEAGSPGFLHLYWVRVSDPSGTTLMDFEFNKSKVACATGSNVQRTAGDMLVEYSIDQGGSRATITIRRWTGTDWGGAFTLDPADATGTINSSPITAANTGGVSAENLSARTFGEASIDLSVIFDDEKCESFGSAMLKSRSSDSFTSQLKDFIAPVPIDLTNCGKVIIHKETQPDESDVDFDYTKTFGTDPATVAGFKLNDKTNDTKTFENVLFGNDYTVTEDALPPGWEFVSLDCSASVDVTPSITDRTVTFDIDSTTDVLECTYTNRARAKLTVIKETRDTTGTFAFTTTGAIDPFSLTTTAVGAAGRDSEVFNDLAPGAYGVTETVPADWNLISAICDNNEAADALTLEAGDDVTCVFLNERERGAIKITKTRKHAAAPGGVGPHSGVTFTVSGNGITPAVVQTDASGIACVPGLLDGSYTVVETVPTGYLSDDASKDVSVTAEGTCTTGVQATVSFVNTPLTNISVTVDSIIAGGTASTVDCKDAANVTVVSGSTNAAGDLTLNSNNMLPTDPAVTLVCTIIVDP